MPRRRKNAVGAYFGGLLTGVLVSGLVLVLLVYSALQNPQKLAGYAERLGLVTVVEKTVVKTVTRTLNSMPREQVAVRQTRINESVQKLTEAYAQGKLTFEHIETLSDHVYGTLADQKVTVHEIDELLDQIDNLVR